MKNLSPSMMKAMNNKRNLFLLQANRKAIDAAGSTMEVATHLLAAAKLIDLHSTETHPIIDSFNADQWDVSCDAGYVVEMIEAMAASISDMEEDRLAITDMKYYIYNVDRTEELEKDIAIQLADLGLDRIFPGYTE